MINAALGNMLAIMAATTITYQRTPVQETDSRKAYNVLIDPNLVVNPISPSTPTSSFSGSAKKSITTYADKLYAAAYPFLKDFKMSSDLGSKLTPRVSTQKVAKDIGKIITPSVANTKASLKEEAKDYSNHTCAIDMTVDRYVQKDLKLLNARAAYNAHIVFLYAEKVNNITPSTPTSPAPGGIADDMKDFSKFLSNDVDWTSDSDLKPIQGADPQKVSKAIGNTITTGEAMQGASLKEAVCAHVQDIGVMNENGALVQTPLESNITGLGKEIASVPTCKVMEVFTSIDQVVGSFAVPTSLFPQRTQRTLKFHALLGFKMW